MNDKDFSGPKTVIRPRSAFGKRPDPALFTDLARPVFALAESLIRDPAPNANRLLTQARDVLDAFEKEALRRGVGEASVAPARYALLVVLDTHARANRKMPLKAWSAGAMAALFRGRDTNLEGLRKIREQGQRAGTDYADLVAFIDNCIALVDGSRTFKPVQKKSARGKAVFWCALVLVLALAGWGGWSEWRFRGELLSGLPDEAAMMAAGAQMQIPAFVSEMDRLAAAVAAVDGRAGSSPLGLVHLFGWSDPGQAARERFGRVADAIMPKLIGDALAVAIASDGTGIALYDDLRVRSILQGEATWNPVFLRDWLTAREELIPGISGLARHVKVMGGPADVIGEADGELLAQAVVFAGEATISERAFLELSRSAEAAHLSGWNAVQRVSRIDAVLTRRSGKAMDDAIGGLFTAAGWDWAKSSGVAAALVVAQAESARLGVAIPAAQGDDGALVLDHLQTRTIEVWKAFLADIRVKPFSDQPGAVLISGILGASNSPLAQLLTEVWLQSGGNDRSRSHPNQLKIATEFGTALQFVEQGKMADISQMFAALNVALASIEVDQAVGARRLMDVQSRANSIATLRQAPVLVGQIVEDVLAQTSASSEDLLDNAVNALWRNQVYVHCGPVMASTYPFVGGADIAPEDFAELVGPDGMLASFFSRQLARLMDRGTSPWRWLPEARLAGFTPESAAFFERLEAARQAYFGDASSMAAAVQLSALAERGSAEVSFGGSKAPVVTTGEAATLQWPGPQPELGVSILFETGAGQQSLQSLGPWGLLHLLDGLRIRERDGGQRLLVDLRSGDARLFMEMAFDTAANPVSGRDLLRDLQCPESL